MCIWLQQKITEQKSILIFKQVYRGVENALPNRLGGDFNLVPDLWLDRLPSTRQCHAFDETMLELMTKANLVDYWRMKNPTRKQFTWFNASNNVQCSRLDYWLISNNLINDVSKCEILASPLIDHCAITLSFQFHRGESNLIPIWKFNNSLR